MSELEVALLAEAPKQWNRFQLKQTEKQKGKPKWQREIEEIYGKVADSKEMANSLKLQHDELMRIGLLLERKRRTTGKLRCAKCGGFDKGNTLNGKPWCMECNVPLESSKHMDSKKHFPIIKSILGNKKLEVTFTPLDGGTK